MSRNKKAGNNGQTQAQCRSSEARTEISCWCVPLRPLIRFEALRPPRPSCRLHPPATSHVSHIIPSPTWRTRTTPPQKPGATYEGAYSMDAAINFNALCDGVSRYRNLIASSINSLNVAVCQNPPHKNHTTIRRPGIHKPPNF